MFILCLLERLKFNNYPLKNKQSKDSRNFNFGLIGTPIITYTQ